jgi:molybdopterin/thiamine biosynthesis adenylyltransferase
MAFHNEHLTRQADIIPNRILEEKITIIGAGAIGGWTALSLAKMGFSDITVWDFDKVDIVNLNSQFYRKKDVGFSKHIALYELIHEFTEIKIGYQGRYEGGIFPGIVISAVDSMEVRRLIWENHAGKAIFTKAVIDPRMGAEQALLYVMDPMNPKDQEAYTKTLYSDQEAVQERCTAKAVIYTANLLSGLVVKAVKDVLTKPDYLRVAQWNILENELTCFKKNSNT